MEVMGTPRINEFVECGMREWLKNELVFAERCQISAYMETATLAKRPPWVGPLPPEKSAELEADWLEHYPQPQSDPQA